MLFDGVCNLCIGMVQFVIRRDSGRKFKFALLQSESAKALLKQTGLPFHNLNSFVFIKGDKHYLRSSAVLHVFKELGGMWKLFYCFIILPAPLRDFVYGIIARTRYRIFGRREQCMVPTQSTEDRFL